MVLDAEKSGRIKKGDVLIEPTSGNTGIGMALAAAIQGFKMIITLPEKMSKEKVDVLKALGAEIVRTPTEAAFDSPDSHIGVAARMNKEIPNSHILDQYANPSNPLAHYDGTAEEIIQQCEGKLDVIVASAGTGGTISGIARKIKERLPNVKIVGIDPLGSILAQPESLNSKIVSYKVEGIGYDFIPKVLDRSLVDHWLKSDDPESFKMARRLIRSEGLLCGGSSGAAMWGAIQAAKELKLTKEHRVVVILPDSVRNYMTKFLSDEWMVENGFMEPPKSNFWWSSHTVSHLRLSSPETVGPTVTVQACTDIMNKLAYDQLPVISSAGELEGVITMGALVAKLSAGKVSKDSPISSAVFRQFRKVSPQTTLSELSNIFDKDHFAIVINTQRHHEAGAVVEKTMCLGVVTRIDLINYLTSDANPSSPKEHAEEKSN